MAILEALEEENTKDTPSFGTEDLEEIHRSSIEAGLCCQLERDEEGNSSNMAELGAACLALEDAKRIQDRNPIILLSDSACFLSSSQKMGRGGEIPLFARKPRRGHHERYSTTPT